MTFQTLEPSTVVRFSSRDVWHKHHHVLQVDRALKHSQFARQGMAMFCMTSPCSASHDDLPGCV